MYSLVIPLWESVRVNKPVVSGALSGTSSFPEQENKLDNAIKVTKKRPFTEVVPGAPDPKISHHSPAGSSRLAAPVLVSSLHGADVN